MSEMILHYCPHEDGDEVFVREGELCPNDCGWLAVDESDERRTVAKLQKMIDAYGFKPLADVARETGKPYMTLMSAVRQGRLPAIQVGGIVLVRSQAVAGMVGLTAGGRGKYRRVRKEAKSDD